MGFEPSKEVLAAFGNYEPDLPDYTPGEMVVEPMAGGLINHTFKVCSEFKTPFILQCINKYVFQDPTAVQENYINIWEYAQYESTRLRIPEPRYCSESITLYVDESENYWRAFEYIGNTKSFAAARTKNQVIATTGAFARFSAAFHDFHTELLKSVIPGFHDLGLRYTQFEESLKGEYYERMSKAISLVDELKKRERYKHFYEIMTESPADFPLRVMHHDAKIANVLFNKKNGRVICPIDLDTVMPGYFFSDLGDMIRSMACVNDENSREIDKIRIRKDYYNAIVSNYLSIMGNQLTASEKKYIHYAGLLMVYMQALRFLTDYLNGDIYYRTNYPDQNFDRAMNQYVLLMRLEEWLLPDSPSYS